MRTGKVSFGPTSRLVTVTDPLPPGVTSCAITSSVIPRILRCVEFRNVRAACKSSSIATPRAVSLESPKSEVITDTGESFGRSILTPAPSEQQIKARPNLSLLLGIVHLVGRDLTAIGIHIAQPRGALHTN